VTKLANVINCFPPFSQKGLGKTNLVSHSIDVGIAKPVKQRQLPVSPAVEEAMCTEIDRMLLLGVIVESESAWSSPIVMITKPGRGRFCLDCRKVNCFTEKDAYINGIQNLDLKDAYWQVALDPQSRDKTAFTVTDRPLYQFTLMPFGLFSYMSTMFRLVNRVVPAHLRNEVFIYLIDLLRVSFSFEGHLNVHRELALHIKRAVLTLNIAKSQFCMRRLRYLGHIIGDGRLQTDRKSVAVNTDFPLPKGFKSLRSLMGLCGWYRKFVVNFAKLSAPLTDLMTTKLMFGLTMEAIEVFSKLKECLRSCVVRISRSRLQYIATPVRKA